MAYGRVYGTSLVLLWLLTLPMSIVYYALSMLFLTLASYPVDWNATLLHIVLPASLLNMVAILVLFPLLRAVHRRTLPRLPI